VVVGNNSSGNLTGNGTTLGNGTGGGPGSINGGGIRKGLGNGSGNGTGNGSGNGTGSSGSTSSRSGGTGSTGIRSPSAPQFLNFRWDISPWIVLAAALLLSVVVVLGASTKRAVVARRSLARPDRGPTGGPGGPVDRESLREALARASAELDHGDDPRETIVRLYVTLLASLAPQVGDVTAATPEEIRHAHLVRLGVRANASEDLTRLFESARYSTQPMGATEASKFRETLRAAEEDLGHGSMAG
jgi:hypothetical protein